VGRLAWSIWTRGNPPLGEIPSAVRTDVTRKTVLKDFLLAPSPVAAPSPPTEGWIRACVPGGVHESLVAAGMLAHPHLGEHEADARWVEDRSWWYQASFARPEDVVPGDRLVLEMDRLDTVAQVWLNGQAVASHCNQHRPLLLDVSDRLRPVNDLLIRFDPPLPPLSDEELDAAGRAMQARREAIRPGAPEQSVEDLTLPVRRSQRRKATFSWGWDFGPRVPSLGLGTAVVLHHRHGAHLSGLQVRTASLDVQALTANLLVSVELTDLGAQASALRITVTTPSGDVVRRTVGGTSLQNEELRLDGVQLWWTHDLGAQPLYTVDVAALAGSTVVDEVSTRIGLRTLTLDQSADNEKPGRLFRFVLNGQPLFARGANWVPASTLVGSVTDQTHKALIGLAVEAQMTMLRVWGGGIYEPDSFYDACDEAGILIWQDFMFACFDYPSDDEHLRAEVHLEAVHQVQRLRSHACLALWCGNNEVQAIHQLTTGTIEPGPWGWSLFHELLPEVVTAHDPNTPYWPGSPWGDTPGEIVNGVSDGDRHAWEVWHGVDVGAGGPTEFATRGEAVHFHRYAHDNGRFISEFGIHAAPELPTLERWAGAGALALRNQAFDHRNKDTPKDKGYALMERETGHPVTLSEYVDFSMACQAEGLKFGVEHYRRRQPHCSGTLVWQLNDVWPGFSWSVIDADLVPKASYYFLQRAYRPVVVSFRETAGGLELWATSSATLAHEVDLVVEISDFQGHVKVRQELTVVVPPYSSQVVWETSVQPGAGQLAWVDSPTQAIEPNRLFFGPLKVLPLSTGRLNVEAKRLDDDIATLTLTAERYCYFARVQSDLPGVRFSDNYLDLRTCEQRRITVRGLAQGARLSTATYGAAPISVQWQ
jgi:beta-mannosidase